MNKARTTPDDGEANNDGGGGGGGAASRMVSNAEIEELRQQRCYLILMPPSTFIVYYTRSGRLLPIVSNNFFNCRVCRLLARFTGTAAATTTTPGWVNKVKSCACDFVMEMICIKLRWYVLMESLTWATLCVDSLWHEWKLMFEARSSNCAPYPPPDYIIITDAAQLLTAAASCVLFTSHFHVLVTSKVEWMYLQEVISAIFQPLPPLLRFTGWWWRTCECI